MSCCYPGVLLILLIFETIYFRMLMLAVVMQLGAAVAAPRSAPARAHRHGMPSSSPSLETSALATPAADGGMFTQSRGSAANGGQLSVLSRRTALACALAFLPVDIAQAGPALLQQGSPSTIRFRPAPLEYLEPIYELKLSIDALANAVSEPARWPALLGRLERFFGGPLSEQYYYAGLSLQYVKNIVYDDLDSFVDADKQARQEAMNAVISALRELRDALKAGAAATPDEAMRASVTAKAAAAQRAMERWMSFVPALDVQRVDALLRAIRAADADRNGKLTGAELSTLGPDEQSLWKRVENIR